MGRVLVGAGVLGFLFSPCWADDRVVVAGTFYDCRFGEMLLGSRNVSLAPQVKVFVEGQSVELKELNAKGMKMAACAHLNSLGQAEEVHLRLANYEHEPNCRLSVLNYGPRGECLGGEPVFVQFYAFQAATEYDSLRLYIDGQLVESGQIKQPGLIYYPSAVGSGRHHFRFVMQKDGVNKAVLDWSSSDNY
ncbi:MAG: hypothetical protein ACI38Q_09460 [Candidatus Bruticola sp.]